MAEQLSAAKLVASKARRKRNWINCGVAVAVIVVFFLIMAISDAMHRSGSFPTSSSSNSNQSANVNFSGDSGEPASLLADPDFASCVLVGSIGPEMWGNICALMALLYRL
jgi:hypothetical protein